MSTLEEIKQKIEKALPGAKVELTETRHNPTHDEGKHLAASIIYQGFEGKTLVEQHQMIYKILEKELQEEIHALTLRTKPNNEPTTQR